MIRKKNFHSLFFLCQQKHLSIFLIFSFLLYENIMVVRKTAHILQLFVEDNYERQSRFCGTKEEHGNVFSFSWRIIITRSHILKPADKASLDNKLYYCLDSSSFHRLIIALCMFFKTKTCILHSRISFLLSWMQLVQSSLLFSDIKLSDFLGYFNEFSRNKNAFKLFL